MTKRVSIDNGHRFHEAWEIIGEIQKRDLWDTLVSLMDDNAREETNRKYAPCSNLAFLQRYLEIAPCNLVIG